MEILEKMEILDEKGMCRVCGQDLTGSVQSCGKDNTERRHKLAHQRNLGRAFFVAAEAAKIAVEQRGLLKEGDPIFANFAKALVNLESFEEEYA